ncbi:MAG: hypothetical protein J0H00_18345 [Burkholderiales bacterium]|nr:hypothetical protein [Burkholderiales bacterium]OJX00834.1 MAG: hypothetical protein BGO72_05520 [Burkholderiales bacterium 70-64]
MNRPRPTPDDWRFEHRAEPLLTPQRFRHRMGRYVLAAAALVWVSLAVGMLGYHYLESLPWIDAFLNAAMILGGMGPVDTLRTPGGKLFAGLYALYAGVLFLAVAGLVFGPLMHRLLHRFHVDTGPAPK